MFTARELAGQAAVQRLTPEEQEVEDCCGHTRANTQATVAAVAATPAAESTVDGKAENGFPSREASSHKRPMETHTHADMEDGKDANVVQDQGYMAETDAGRGEQGRLLDGDDARSMDVELVAQEASATEEEEEGDGDVEIVSEEGGVVSPSQPKAAELAATRSPSENHRNQGDDFPDQRKAEGGSNSEKMDSSEEAEPVSSASSPRQQLTPASTPQPSRPPSPLDELVAMGFPRDAATEALSACGGSIPDAAYRLVTSLNSDGGNAEEHTNGNGSTDHSIAAGSELTTSTTHDTGGAGETVRLSRDVRLQRGAETIAAYPDRRIALQVCFSKG